MARVTGLEPATSGVTGRHSNQLSYTRAFPKTPAGKPVDVSGCLGGGPLAVKHMGVMKAQWARDFIRHNYRCKRLALEKRNA